MKSHSFIYYASRVSWLMLGILIAAISLIRLNQTALKVPVLANEIERPPVAPDPSLLADLPQPENLPGTVSYPVQAITQWGWWRSADSPQERHRRLLWLSNQRLRAGYELICDGQTDMGVGTLIKAESYLQKAASISGQLDDRWQAELEWSLQRHQDVLHDSTVKVDDATRTQIYGMIERTQNLQTAIERE